MARWRLTNKHYINVPGTEWEYEEVSRETGKRARKRFAVPLFLNPDDPSDCNYSGEIIVAYEDKKHERKDILFLGDPTPDMEAIDEEAEAISLTFKDRWSHPIESLPSNGDFSQSLLTVLQRQLDEALRKNPLMPTNASEDQVGKGAFAELQAQVNQLMEQNAELMKLVPKAEKPQVEKRI